MGVLLDLDFPELREGASMSGHDRAWFDRRHRYEGQWIYDTIPDSAAARLYGNAPAAAAASDVGAAPLPEATLANALRATEAWRPPLEPEARASNVFAVGARRSASGRPLLANDPHLPLTIPGP